MTIRACADDLREVCPMDFTEAHQSAALTLRLSTGAALEVSAQVAADAPVDPHDQLLVQALAQLLDESTCATGNQPTASALAAVTRETIDRMPDPEPTRLAALVRALSALVSPEPRPLTPEAEGTLDALRRAVRRQPLRTV